MNSLNTSPPSSCTFSVLMTILIIFSNLPSSQSDPRISEAGFFCGGTSPSSTILIPLYVSDMEMLSQQVTANLSGHSSLDISSANVSIFTLAQCHHDLSRDDCLQCYAASRTLLPRCLPSRSGRIFLDGCFLRYDSYDFFNESVSSSLDAVNCNSSDSDHNSIGSNDLGFQNRVQELVKNVSMTAVARGGHAVGGSVGEGVYALAECWESLSVGACRECLVKASRELNKCLPGREGRAMNAGCYLRYSTVKFFDNTTEIGATSNGVSRSGKTLAISLSVVAFSMICLFAAYATYARWRKQKLARANLGKISYSYNKSNLNFKYETLEKATNYFDPSRKLGQGGAGSVYKGTLRNGKTVAVKRLFFSTRQWVDEFFNEVNLISGVEHKNLAKLLGCSIEGPESLLVYEFVPNKSLEQHLFDEEKIRVLNWKERYNIIVGMAEGIAFLHGGLAVRIIHRDIKCSNLLLSENLEPKIADFGLARSFAADKSHLSTGIAGTLGYMSPEYLVKGQLTEKADVYSYGVVVLEIVCSRRNNAFVEDSGSLLQTVWKLYKTERLPESVDPNLKGDFPPTEASKVLKIGLLCTQASPSHRPSMDDVVRMLTEENCDIPEPNQPPFLNTGALSVSTTTPSSYSVNSSNTSNVMARVGTSYHSSDLSKFQSSSEGLSRIQLQQLFRQQ